MAAQTILDEAAETTSWNTESMLAIALDYIDSLHKDDEFADYVECRVKEEMAG